MESKRGRLVKAVYDFATDDPSELSLLAGDVVQIQDQFDKQWCVGLCNGQQGNFPVSFTMDLKIPCLEEQDQLFAVANDFIAEQEGDLTLRKGELVVGKQKIDQNWWSGEIDGRVGIFPVTHIWKVDKSLLPNPTTGRKLAMKGKVKMDMKAQLDQEMDLKKDDIVIITEEVEKGWYRGECNGRRGIFPASFVTILSDDSADIQQPLPGNSNFSSATNQNNNCGGYDCIDPYGKTTYPFRAENANELSFDAGEIIKLKRYIDSNWMEGEINGKTGVFPSSFVKVVVDCPNQNNGKEKEGNLTEEIDLFPADTYGRVLYDFEPQVDGDVRLTEGETVTLIRKIDQNWYEVVTDNGDVGICPENRIEVIGSGPPSYHEVMSANYDFPINQSSSFCGSNTLGRNANSSLDELLCSASSNHSSSFSSQNGSDKSFNFNYSPKSAEDKIAECLNFNLPIKSSNNIYDNSLLSQSDLNDSGICLQKTGDAEESFVARDLYQNIPSEVNRTYDNQGNDQPILQGSTAPTRPPPPSNVGGLPKVSSFENSNWTSNSTRNSTISTSSSSSLEGNNLEEKKLYLHQKEQTLKIRVACRNKLENETSNSAFVSSDVKLQLSQINEEIKRLNSEIADLKSQIEVESAGNGSDFLVREEEAARNKEAETKRREQEKVKKMKEQRDCIITELLQTERDYLSDLKLLQDLFLRNPSEAKEKGIDVPTLFGNIDEVIDVAGRLLKRLQKVSRDTQIIGECFVDLSDDMKEIYGHYCRNHDEVNSLLDKIDNNSPAGQFLNHKIEQMKRQTNCFDLPAMLIKPVQRILKYPLLLNELLKCTDDNHPDKQWLLQATNLMTDVATAVNEFKRRKDLVFKYRKQADTSLSGRISKFNIHSMAKKTSRIGMRLSNSFGFKAVIKDEEFDKVVRRFNGLEKSIKIFQKDVCDYTKKMEELVTTAFNMSEDIAEWYQERRNQREVEEFQSVHRTILTQNWDNFKQTIERSVNAPIKMLLQTFQGPVNLIQKRYDKLLDYESSSSKVEKNKDVTKKKMLQDNLTMAKNTYEALNSQLLDDLPKLCDISIEILYDCIRCFLKTKKTFVGKSALQLFNLMDLPLLLGSQGGILETFKVKHTLVLNDLSQLTILPKEMQSSIKTDTLKRNSSPRGSKLSFSGLSKSQSSHQKVKVKASYNVTDLFTACEDFVACGIMDVSLKKGDIVGVLKREDPMGNKRRWFVDNGEEKGFVPAKCLMKFLPNLSSQSSTSFSEWDSLGASSDSKSAPSPVQDLYSKPHKAITNSKPSEKVLRPVRPAPTAAVATSLREVAPSRYPPQRQDSTSRAEKLPVNKMVSVDTEPDHRYEEIDDSKQPNSGGVNLLGAEKPPSSVIEEFDPYSASPRVPKLYDNLPDNVNNLYSSNRYEEVPDEAYYEEVPGENPCESQEEYFYGMYDFSPTGLNQLGIRKGQVVLVLHKCDLNRNSEWWFVEDRHGNKGYVPAAYLSKYSTDVAS